MKMSGIQKLTDFPLNNYSLDSLNEFLKMETVTRDKRVENNSSNFTPSEPEKENFGTSTISFAAKDRDVAVQ